MSRFHFENLHLLDWCFSNEVLRAHHPSCINLLKNTLNSSHHQAVQSPDDDSH